MVVPQPERGGGQVVQKFKRGERGLPVPWGIKETDWILFYLISYEKGKNGWGKGREGGNSYN